MKTFEIEGREFRGWTAVMREARDRGWNGPSNTLASRFRAGARTWDTLLRSSHEPLAPREPRPRAPRPIRVRGPGDSVGAVEQPTPLAHPVPAACQRLGISRSTLYELIADGAIKVIHIGRRVLVTEAELQRFVAELVEKAG